MMKKVMAVLLGSMFFVSASVQAEPNAADKKWLELVQKVIAKGETSITAANQQRVALLKDWATKKGYTFLVGKTDTGYQVELFPKVALK